jgi:hypothetical protein
VFPKKNTSQQIIRSENEAHAEMTLGKRKEQIPEHVEPEVKRLKINTP